MTTLQLVKGSGRTSVAAVVFVNPGKYISPTKYSYLVEHDEHGNIEVSVGDYAIVNSPSIGYTMVRVVGLEADVGLGSKATKPILKFISTRNLGEYEKRRCYRIDQQKKLAKLKQELQEYEETMIRQRIDDEIRKRYASELETNPVVVKLRAQIAALAGPEVGHTVADAMDTVHSMMTDHTCYIGFMDFNKIRNAFYRSIDPITGHVSARYMEGANKTFNLPEQLIEDLAMKTNLHEPFSRLVYKLREGNGIVSYLDYPGTVGALLFPLLLFRTRWSGKKFYEEVENICVMFYNVSYVARFSSELQKVLMQQYRKGGKN